VRFDRPIAQDMLDVIFIAKFAAHQDGAVTFKWIFFSAHQCEPVAFRAFSQARQSILKRPQLHNLVISRDSFHVTFTLRPARAQLIAQENVTDPIFLEARLKRGSIEVWRPPAKRVASDIGQSVNAMPLQQFQERFKAVS
jgi:hypothetical protein